MSAALLLLAGGCPAGEGASTDTDPSTSAAPTGSPTAPTDSDSDPTGGATDPTGGAIGPTAQIRLVNLVPGLTFDMWGADEDFMPVLIAEGIAPETASDYIDVPVNPYTMDPGFVLVPAGEVIEATPTWQTDAGAKPDHANINIDELDGAGQRATVIGSRDMETNELSFEHLDETELQLGDVSQANLHISYKLFDLPGTVVPAIAIVGQPCLFTGSTAAPQAWSVAPGSFELGVYDIQTESECTVQLASAPITAAAGDQVLVAIYHIDSTVKLLTAPIAPG
ncbi:hypothetical protein POL58_10025 [Nannocystis sp. ncelm1]|uniref:DUF4382 domain-containing protein n=2 Tax=Nannocystis radixulma TaxID=2995305 RepID=A0ABT5B4T7_9BACT|nr:hypothetical protein [Nannocystis radixulma]